MSVLAHNFFIVFYLLYLIIRNAIVGVKSLSIFKLINEQINKISFQFQAKFVLKNFLIIWVNIQSFKVDICHNLFNCTNRNLQCWIFFVFLIFFFVIIKSDDSIFSQHNPSFGKLRLALPTLTIIVKSFQHKQVALKNPCISKVLFECRRAIFFYRILENTLSLSCEDAAVEWLILSTSCIKHIVSGSILVVWNWELGLLVSFKLILARVTISYRHESTCAFLLWNNYILGVIDFGILLLIWSYTAHLFLALSNDVFFHLLFESPHKWTTSVWDLRFLWSRCIHCYIKWTFFNLWKLLYILSLIEL